jgi:lycopene cyclase domain-containing protein
VSTYGWVLFFTIIGPLLLSFDKKVHFNTYFKILFLSILPIASFFLVWDTFFTSCKIWGFEPCYLSKVYLYNLPIEEVLFFFLVPFSCLFIYEVLRAYFPFAKLDKLATFFSYTIIAIGCLMIINGIEKWYTTSACSLACLLVFYLSIINKKPWFPYFSLTFLISLIPFIIVNGVLTGAVTQKPIVWYNQAHILGLRIITIPIEDIYYNLSMLLPIVWLYEKLKLKYNM